VATSLLQTGDWIEGKWAHHRYRVKKRLGSGANGDVFLVHGAYAGTSNALKVCDRAGDIAFEWSLLEKLWKQANCFPQPIQIDDDTQRASTYFYVMEFVEGQPLNEVFARCSERDIRELTKSILTGLSTLHNTQHAFCDIKPQNIMVQLDQHFVRFVDVGGVTPFARSVRQFTPYYDRAFWGLGSRQADAQYDLCGLALVLVCLAEVPPTNLSSRSERDRRQWLYRAVARFPWPRYIPVLSKALAGQFATAEAFRLALEGAILSDSRKARRGANKSRLDWTERLMWFSLASATVVTVLAWASFVGWV